MRAKADGYTILMGHQGTHAFSVSLYPNLAYKPDVDFEPIGLVAETPNFIVARNDFPPKDLRESNHRHGLRCLRRRGHRSRYSTV
jgi:tripartite-type tricarboxylate transporter receptor subunit TctC